MRAVAGALFFPTMGVAIASCSSSGDVVFGVRSELIAGSTVTRLNATITVDGEIVETRTVEGGALDFPLELRVDDAPAGARVDLALEAFRDGNLMLERAASTTVEANRTLLYELSLDIACVGETCSGATTCDQGDCVDPLIDPQNLGDYFADWAGPRDKDRCEPGGPPTVLVGEGQGDYHAVSAGEILQVEAGPQGGYHVWIAARIKNLTQSGSIIEISGRVPALDYDVQPMLLAFTFDPDEGDYCKIYGLRFRLDDDAHPIASLLGQSIDIRVKITDKDGDIGIGTLSAKLSDDFI